MPTLTEVRLRACKLWPYGSHAILSLVPVEKPGLGTMAVDKHWRLYFDPQAIADQPLDESAGVILHEVSHLLLKHHRRAERLVPGDAPPQHWKLWNVATDYAINSMLRQEGIRLWDGVLYPEQQNLPVGLSADEYFHRLFANEQAKQQDDKKPSNDESGKPQSGGDNVGDSSGQGDDTTDGKDADTSLADGDQGAARSVQSGRPDSAPGGGDGGSCADGRQRPWELPAPSNCDTPGMKPHEVDIMAREAAQKILDKQQGDGSGGWKVWAEGILRPRVDPKLALLRLVRHAVEFTSGQGDYSYRRPNRRNQRPDILLGSAVQPIPRVTVIVDTSGSMDQRDLALALGLIGKVLNTFRIRDGIRVICGDTSAATTARVFDPKQVTLAGGGGTNMGTLIRETAQAKPRPQLIVVCTDGITPWCEPVGIPVVACLTQDKRADRVPSWIRTVVL